MTLDKKKVAILFAIVLLIPPGLANAQTGEIDDIEQDYTLEEINHAFTVMEKYVIYDENKNIRFDVKSTQDTDVTQIDIDVALDFAAHNDDIINAAIGPTGKTDELNTNDTELKRALKEFETGKFKALFGKTDSVGSTGEIQLTLFDFTAVPIISAFGVDEVQIQKIRHSSNSNSVLACGGNYQNPHTTDSTPTTVSGFSSLSAAQTDLYKKRYHMVPAYATFGGEATRSIDFAKFVSSGAPGNCNSGQFRDQAIIDRDGASYRVFEDEPNPEVLSYVWPRIWWGTYVQWWHATF